MSLAAVRATFVVGLCALACSLAACGPSASDQIAERLAEGQAALAEDPSAALQIARKALLDLGEDPQLELLAATACIQLNRRGEALTHAEQGLAGERELPEDVAADLAWAKGFALMGRYHDLHAEDDWRAANTTLERATTAGSHRAEAAFLLAALQDMGQHRDDDRQLKYARLLRQLDPDSPRIAELGAVLEKKGLSF